MTQDKGRADFIRAAVERFEKPLVSYAFHMTGEIERARDTVQETFMRLCKAEPEQVQGHLAPWLYTVCRNLALDAKRKEARMKQLNGKETETFVSTAPQPAALLERTEDSQNILVLIGTLPENQQEAIGLKFRQGLKYREIAEVMETTASNVGFLIHKGINAIRKKLSPIDAASGKEVRHDDR